MLSSIACGSGPEHRPQLLKLGIELLNKEGLLDDHDVLLVAQHRLTCPAAYRRPIRAAHGQAGMGGTTVLWSRKLCSLKIKTSTLSER